MIGHSFKKGAFFVFSENLATTRQGPAGKGRLHIDYAGATKKGAGIKLPQGVAEAAPFFIWEESNMSKNKVIPLCSWRDVPIPQRCEGCPYPKVGFVCYGKDGSCLRSDVQEMEVRQASKKAK